MLEVIPSKEVKTLQAATLKQVDVVEAKVIRSQPDLDEAVAMLKGLKEVQKQVKEKKESVTKPLNEALKAARSLFEPMETALAAAEAKLKGRMLTYQASLAKKVEVAVEKAEEKIAEGGSFAQAGKAVAKAAARVDAVPTMTVKKVLVEDESKLPDAYWVIDQVKLRKDLLAGVVVPGAKIVEEQTIRV